MGIFQVMLIILLSAVSRAQKCSYPWKEIEGDCWGFFGFEKGIDGTWNNAKLECERKGAVLGYPRKNTSLEDIYRAAKASPEFSDWKWLNVGLHSTICSICTYVVLETGEEPNGKIPWTNRFPQRGIGWTCVFLNIGLESGAYRPGQLGNSACDDVWPNNGYACKNLDHLTAEKSTTEATTTQSTAAPTTPIPTPKPTTKPKPTGATSTLTIPPSYLLYVVIISFVVAAGVSVAVVLGCLHGTQDKQSEIKDTDIEEFLSGERSSENASAAKGELATPSISRETTPQSPQFEQSITRPPSPSESPSPSAEYL